MRKPIDARQPTLIAVDARSIWIAFERPRGIVRGEQGRSMRVGASEQKTVIFKEGIANRAGQLVVHGLQFRRNTLPTVTGVQRPLPESVTPWLGFLIAYDMGTDPLPKRFLMIA
jgi:hypothetical protein